MCNNIVKKLHAMYLSSSTTSPQRVPSGSRHAVAVGMFVCDGLIIGRFYDLLYSGISCCDINTHLQLAHLFEFVAAFVIKKLCCDWTMGM